MNDIIVFFQNGSDNHLVITATDGRLQREPEDADDEQAQKQITLNT